MRLIKAFIRIARPAVRLRIVNLVQEIGAGKAVRSSAILEQRC
jgi:hypothetical protein